MLDVVCMSLYVQDVYSNGRKDVSFVSFPLKVCLHIHYTFPGF